MTVPKEPIDAKHIRGLLGKFNSIFDCHRAIMDDYIYCFPNDVYNGTLAPLIHDDCPVDNLFYHEGKVDILLGDIWGRERYKWALACDKRNYYDWGCMDFGKFPAYELILSAPYDSFDFVGIFKVCGETRRLDRWPVYHASKESVDIFFVGSLREYLRGIAVCVLRAMTRTVFNEFHGEIWAQIALDAEMMHRIIELSKLLMVELRYLSLEADALAVQPDLYDFRNISDVLNMVIFGDLTFVGTEQIS
jgi:hypothetical protein